MSEEDQLADTYNSSDRAAIANLRGGRYHRNQKFSSDLSQDAAVSIKENGIEMYGLFCGFRNGGTVAEFAKNRMAFEVFGEPDPITKDMDSDQIVTLLNNKYLSVNKRYEQELEDYLSQIFLLKEEENPDEERIKELQAKVRAGCTALIILRIWDDLYVLSCGNAQALIFTDSQQVSCLVEPVHDKDNPDEYKRLANLGIDPEKWIGPTRAIGDGYRSIRYDEEPDLMNAKGPPVIHEPDVFSIKIQPGWRHLLLVSPGMIQNIKDCDVEGDPASEIFYQFQECQTLNGTAKTVVFNVGRKHEDAYDMHVAKEGSHCNYRDEMSVVYVKLLDGTSFISTIDSSINSTIASITFEPEAVEPYVDLSPTRAEAIAKDIEPLLIIPEATPAASPAK